MRILAITPTDGNRPESLALCRHWMKEQTRPPDDHVVLEGGTLWDNILAATVWNFDAIAIVEDDDYYAPRWLEVVERGLERSAAFGKECGHMYHVPAGVAAIREHPGRAPLCATAMRLELWPRIRRIAGREHENIDTPFWEGLHRTPYTLTTERLVVSIKGMPSGDVYTKKHRASKFRSMPCAWREEDPDRAILREWVGDEALELYRPYFGRDTEGLRTPTERSEEARRA